MPSPSDMIGWFRGINPLAEIAARRTGVYHATVEELQAIDEALGQVARGKLVDRVP